MARVHIVGGGLAGLAAGVALAKRGRAVVLYEAAAQAGGRCRSYHDATLDRVIDNGNHLLMSGNTAALDYLAQIGAGDSLAGPANSAFPFVDLKTGARWTVRPNKGLLPWWIFSPARRIPGTRAGDYLGLLRLAGARAGATIGDYFDADAAIYRRFVEPLAVAALNTPAEAGDARLLWAVIERTFVRGLARCRPLIARESLTASFIDPALAYLKRHGAGIQFNQRLRALALEAGRVAALEFTRSKLALDNGDHVILAVPAPVAAALVPGLRTPEGSHAIVNAHLVMAGDDNAGDRISIVGLIGGTAQWLFRRGDIVSLTVSAADRLADADGDQVARLLWTDTARALGLPIDPMPAVRVIKERRATISQTPAETARRPGARTEIANLFLAGDWTDTGLPATIEGAIRSGRRAAGLIGGN